jgi:hypothetical protein
MAKQPLYDPLFKPTAKPPKPLKETASGGQESDTQAETARTLEEIALSPAPGLRTERIFIGGKNEAIPCYFHAESRTVYPIKE